MKIISIRESPQFKDFAIEYLSSKWDVPRIIYEDSITHSITAVNPLPQWYLLEQDGKIIGCSGLVTNDFISRMDLYPWLCALFIEESHKGNGYGLLLIEKVMFDAKKGGFGNLYLSTKHVGYYEKYGFKYIGNGYHPWNEESRIYEIEL